MTGEKCMKCGAPLSNDEIGIHKKMVNRRSTEFFCIDCLAAHFKIPKDDIYALIEKYRKTGCVLFTRNN